MNFFNLLAPYLPLVLAVLVVIGGGLAFRPNYSKAANEIQKSVIEAMESENAVLDGKIERLEDDLRRLHEIIERQNTVIDTITEALSKRGIRVTIDGDLVIISDASGSSSAKKVTPIRKKPDVKDN